MSWLCKRVKGSLVPIKRFSCINSALNTNSTYKLCVMLTNCCKFNNSQRNVKGTVSFWSLLHPQMDCCHFITAMHAILKQQAYWHGCATPNHINLIVTVPGNGFNCLPSWRKRANWMQQSCDYKNVEEHSHVMMWCLYNPRQPFKTEIWNLTCNVQNQETTHMIFCSSLPAELTEKHIQYVV